MEDIYKCVICGRFTEKRWHCGKPTLLILTKQQRIRLSKLLSGLLRHFPESIGLELDEEGFTKMSIEELVKAIKTKWRHAELYQWLEPKHIYAIVALDPKGRFEIRENKIRARYGHSVKVNIRYRKTPIPRILYHGTGKVVLPKILEEGLKPMKRLKVHLTEKFEDAIENALRKYRDIVVLEVDVKKLEAKGLTVYKAGKNVYVVDYVPPEAIKVCEQRLGR